METSHTAAVFGMGCVSVGELECNVRCQSRIIVFVWNLLIFLDTRNLRGQPEFVLHTYIHTYTQANYLWYLVLLLEKSSKRVGFYGEKMFI